MTVEVRGVDLQLTDCPRGPQLVRGASEVVDAAGVTHAVTRPVVAVCACDRSQRAPWCDGTHKAVERARRHREENARDEALVSEG
jgi:CDGSH-type Zn-finger protein